MALKLKDLPLLDQTIGKLSRDLNDEEKEYAERVCDTVFDGMVPNETWVARCSSITFKRDFQVFHSLPVTNDLLRYINCIACKRFVLTLVEGIQFEFEIDYHGTEDDVPTEEIPPMYWGEYLVDNFQLYVRLKR